MPESQQKLPHVNSAVFINFKPAELVCNSQWLVVYYAKNPINGKMERFRVHVPKLKSTTDRKKLGKKIALEINQKLYNGWLPWYSDAKSSQFKSFDYCKDKFLEITKKEVTEGIKRVDTLRSYTSFLNMIKKYVEEKIIDLNLILNFNKEFVVNYLDWIYYDRANSSRTYNHLNFIGTFISFCVLRGYLKQNFIHSIPKKTKEDKQRAVLSNDIKQKVKQLENTNFHYYCLCMATYFCFIRRTELTKLKVDDVSLVNKCITISSDKSKNRKTEMVTIPKPFAEILIQHLKNANSNDFLFSDDEFRPGSKQLNPKKISDTWDKFRTQFKIENKYQFYSLKDTGITDLLLSGIPAIKVRDQARHYDLKITENYTPRMKKFDDDVWNISFEF
ncbi:MAG: tyrosine-type recombinase/integrase [Flavobacterium sp.]